MKYQPTLVAAPSADRFEPKSQVQDRLIVGRPYRRPANEHEHRAEATAVGDFGCPHALIKRGEPERFSQVRPACFLSSVSQLGWVWLVRPVRGMRHGQP